ncbi:hypothetical protein HHUSO_G27324 [Huso huso]|uniref:CCHC-type domain-containing protein n=1 Tax=Huso huso TaxID=61971 RepID=A0ABR0YK09_HUSHU
MENTCFNDTQIEVRGLLYQLCIDKLIALCQYLRIAGKDCSDVKGKNGLSLIKYVQCYLDRSETEELEDQGMAELLAIKDKIDELMNGDVAAVSNVNEMQGERNQLQRECEELETLLEQKRKEVGMLASQGSAVKVRSASATDSQANGPKLAMFKKDFKIIGQIGEPGQRDKLSFGTLAHQIESGLNKDYTEIEITEAVIRAIVPGLQLRSYLEGKTDLTLPKLRRILRSHFQEKDATKLYKQLTSGVQEAKETPQNFLMRVMDLRQKILFASQESDSGLKYNPELVQRMFLHTVLTELQNDSIKTDMKVYLQDNSVTDEVLLEQLNIACSNDAERQRKLRSTSYKSVKVNALHSDDNQASKQPESKKQDTSALLAELNELKNEVSSLKELKVEIASIRQTLYSSNHGTTVRPNGPPVAVEILRGPWRRGCASCQDKGQAYNCSHCFHCGNDEHYMSGCRKRNGKPPPMDSGNGNQLPPRDRV